MKIRIKEHDDEIRLAEIFNQARESAGCFPCENIAHKEFLKQVEGEAIFVAEVENDIIGFTSVWEPDNFIHHLYVSPKWQRNGVGEQLILHCKNIYGLPLSLKCVTANIVACNFYEKLGWVSKDQAVGPEGEYNHYWLENT